MIRDESEIPRKRFCLRSLDKENSQPESSEKTNERDAKISEIKAEEFLQQALELACERSTGSETSTESELPLEDEDKEQDCVNSISELLKALSECLWICPHGIPAERLRACLECQATNLTEMFLLYLGI